MVENNSADNTFERTLCHGTLQVSCIHILRHMLYNNASYIVDKWLCKDKRIANEQLLPILIFHFVQLV